jgi:hypothetical protein
MVGRPHFDNAAVGCQQNVREDRHGRVRVDDLAGRADRLGDLFGATGKLHYPPFSVTSFPGLKLKKKSSYQ